MEKVIFVVIGIALAVLVMAIIYIFTYNKQESSQEEQKELLSAGLLSIDDVNIAIFIVGEFKRKWPFLITNLQREGDKITYQFRNSNPYDLRIAFLNDDSSISSYYIDTKYDPATGNFIFLLEGIYNVGIPRPFVI